MNRLFQPLLAFALLTTGCANSTHHPTGMVAASVLSPMELIAAIDAHKGRTVTVTGYFTYATDMRALWENEEAHRGAQQLRKGSWDKCITIYASSRLDRQRKLSGHRVNITGKAVVIEKDDMRRLWTCNPIALEDAVITLG